MWGHSEQVAVCNPRGDSSPEPSHTRTFILDFWPPELLENRFLLFKPLSLCYFVTAVQANTGRFFPKDFRENSALLTPWFWTSGLQDCEKINAFCFKPLHLWKLVTAPININTFPFAGPGWMVNNQSSWTYSPKGLTCPLKVSGMFTTWMNYRQYKK